MNASLPILTMSPTQCKFSDRLKAAPFLPNTSVLQHIRHWTILQIVMWLFSAADALEVKAIKGVSPSPVSCKLCFFAPKPRNPNRLQFHENSSKHPKKITLLFFIKNIFLNPGWPSYCIRRYLNTQRCTWPPENLIFQVVTEMLPTESKSQRQIGPYIIALLQNYSFLCVLSFEKHFSPFFGVLIQMLYSYKVFVHTEI